MRPDLILVYPEIATLLTNSFRDTLKFLDLHFDSKLTWHKEASFVRDPSAKKVRYQNVLANDTYLRLVTCNGQKGNKPANTLSQKRHSLDQNRYLVSREDLSEQKRLQHFQAIRLRPHKSVRS